MGTWGAKPDRSDLDTRLLLLDACRLSFAPQLPHAPLFGPRNLRNSTAALDFGHFDFSFAPPIAPPLLFYPQSQVDLPATISEITGARTPISPHEFSEKPEVALYPLGTAGGISLDPPIEA